MSPNLPEPIELFLVTPAEAGADFEPRLTAALETGRIASVLIATGASEEARQAAAVRFVPIIQKAGAAAIVADFTRVAGRARADGIQIGSGAADLRAAVESFRPGSIVGATDTSSRHAAMEAGEAEPDYLLFGQPHGDIRPEPHPKALDLAEWWSELTAIPAVVMAGSSIDSVFTARQTGAAFIGLNRAVWDHPAGAADAIKRILEVLSRDREEAA